MNYRLLLSEMLIDYTERMSQEESSERRAVYKEIRRDLILALDIEPNEIGLIQNVNNILNQ